MALGQQIAHALGLATTADIRNLEDRMTTAEQAESAANEQFVAMLGTAIAEIKSLRDAAAAFPGLLADAFARGDQAAIEKLAADSIKDTERLASYSALLAELYPATVPEVVVPEPGVPAEPAPTPDEVPDIEVPDVVEPEVSIPLESGETGENPPA